jgi:hypothetical protein
MKKDYYNKSNWYQIIRKHTSGKGFYIFNTRFIFENHVKCDCSICKGFW